MNDRELFNAVFDNFAATHHGLRMSGTLVYYKGECVFNTDGYNLEYNLLRLTKLLDDEGEQKKKKTNMETIKITEKDGTVRIFNPMHITDAKLVVSEYNKDWCIVLNTDKPNTSPYSIPFHSKEEAEKEFEYINSCLESI